VVDDPAAIPSAAQATVTVAASQVEAWLALPNSPRIVATADDAPLALLTQLGHVLAPLQLRTRSGRATTIDSAGLFELLEIADPDGVEPDTMWIPRATEDQLITPIGVAEDGTPIMLDIKESSTGGMGPHGMLIGATGSGKSELLRTIVLGLAARHEPEELAFVLVDFKGGATFARLDRLPHSAGMITNLERDPSLIDRMLEALYGELERRQRALHDAGGFDRADEYRAYRSAHLEEGLDPLPALLLVVDEFGELLTAKPEFSDLFATIGRVGRSLGVHLLLSTQRLEDGKVRKLEGHLRYRLCLRTFTPEESMAVIGSKAAAELPPIPGVGYLKVDGGLHAFKAGLVNRPLRGTDRTEMDHLIAALGGEDIADRSARPVWLEPLPTACDLSSLCTRVVSPEDQSWLRVPVGWEDDPRHQQTRPMVHDFTGARGNLAIVGAPRTGKSTLLQTLIASGSLTHRPEDLQFYVVDLGGGSLHLLEHLPHVGAVLSRSHREEISKLIRRLRNLVEDRAEAFRRHRITDMAGFHRLRAEGVIEDEMGEVFLTIDNWGAFTQEQPLEVVDSVSELIGSGLHHGVHVVLATPRWQDIKLAVRDHIGGRFEFRLADHIDSEIDRKAAKSTPADVAGRGMNQETRQVHIALPRIDGRSEPASISAGAELLVEAAGEMWAGHRQAPPIRVLPALVRAADIPIPPHRGMVLGLEEHRLEPWTVDLFGSDPHMLVFGDAEAGKTNMLQRLIEQLSENHSAEEVQVAVVDYRRRILNAVPESHRLGIAATAESAAVIASRISADLSARVLPDEVSTLRHSGPAIVLVVDDYDLVASAAGNPLSPLIDKVAQGRDLGFHLVIARRVGGTARAAFEPLFQRVRELGSPGLILSGDAHEGAMIGGVKAAIRPPGRGTWVSRSKSTEVQVALCEPIGQPLETRSLREEMA
jgi:S-DNA-T family DNA segregation ATPase FtsK/SpoIIIE